WWDFHRGLPVARFEPDLPAPDDLVGTEAFAWVEELRAWSVEDDEAVRALLGSPWLRTVTRLDLSRNSIGSGGAALLAASPVLGRLRDLDRSDGEIEAEGAAALARSPHLSRLLSLSLARNDVEADGIAALADSPYLAGLTSLDLAANYFGPEGA